MHEQRVSDTGNLIDVEIVFASNPNATTNCQQPAVAYATTKDRYLLVFRYDNLSVSWQTIVAVSLAGDAGSPAWSSVVDWDTPDLPEKPDIAYNRSRNECLVVWQQRTGSSGDFDVYAQRVAMTGAATSVGSALPIATASSDEINPAVAAVPTVPDAANYLITWEVGGDIHMQPVDGDGTQHTSRVLANTAWTEHSVAIAGNEARQQFLAVWVWIPVIRPPPMMQVYGRAVTLAGTSLGTAAVEIDGGQVYEAAVAAGDAGDYLVAFDDNEVIGTSNRGIYGRLWGTRVYLPLTLRNSP